MRVLDIELVEKQDQRPLWSLSARKLLNAISNAKECYAMLVYRYAILTNDSVSLSNAIQSYAMLEQF